MKCKLIFLNIVTGICLASLPGWVGAVGFMPHQPPLSTAGSYTQGVNYYMLALNESDDVIEPAGVATSNAMKNLTVQPVEFEPPFFSRSNAHKYLGLGTLALVGLTAIAAPEEDESATVSSKSRTQGTHQSLGRLTAAMAAATVTSGLLAHWDDFHLEDGFTDPDNLHVMFGTLGAMLMLNAVSKAPGSGHPASGIAGGVAMGAAIKLTW